MNLLSISIDTKKLQRVTIFLNNYALYFVTVVLISISILTFIFYYKNGLGLAYNDARSHLDIGRRVVEGLKPGVAQLGSVWLPLPHLLMVPTIWNDFMWHTGLAGALQSMISYVATGLLIFLYLKRLRIGMLGRLTGVLVFAVNMNILYLQSTAMTELLLIATLTAACYEILQWFLSDKIINLIYASFWIMLASLNRYEGWFLFIYAGFLITMYSIKKFGYKAAEGRLFFFSTLAGLGILLWFAWNQLIFHDALYFAFGPYSAHAQQEQLQQAGVLATKGNLLLSIKIYLYALLFNSGVFVVVLSCIGYILFLMDKKITPSMKIASTTLFAPLVFNILALYLGHSVLFIQGISGNTWFNVRYGVMMLPVIAIFTGYLIAKASNFKYLLLGLLVFYLFFSFLNMDAATLDDARVGSSQKNVSQVSEWLAKNAKDKDGFVLISAASHDAIIFSSGLPMSKFIHEGTGAYWESATTAPDSWARWIIMRTNDENDQTFKLIHLQPGFKNFQLVGHYPFADIYELKPQYIKYLHTKPTLKNLK